MRAPSEAGTPGVCCGVVSAMPFCCPAQGAQCYRSADVYRCRAVKTQTTPAGGRPVIYGNSGYEQQRQLEARRRRQEDHVSLMW